MFLFHGPTEVQWRFCTFILDAMCLVKEVCKATMEIVTPLPTNMSDHGDRRVGVFFFDFLKPCLVE